MFNIKIVKVFKTGEHFGVSKLCLRKANNNCVDRTYYWKEERLGET